jgi:hypothetical protein
MFTNESHRVHACPGSQIVSAEITPIGAGGGWYHVGDNSKGITRHVRGIKRARMVALEIDEAPTPPLRPRIDAVDLYSRFIKAEASA